MTQSSNTSDPYLSDRFPIQVVDVEIDPKAIQSSSSLHVQSDCETLPEIQNTFCFKKCVCVDVWCRVDNVRSQLFQIIKLRCFIFGVSERSTPERERKRLKLRSVNEFQDNAGIRIWPWIGHWLFLHVSSVLNSNLDASLDWESPWWWRFHKKKNETFTHRIWTSRRFQNPSKPQKTVKIPSLPSVSQIEPLQIDTLTQQNLNKKETRVCKISFQIYLLSLTNKKQQQFDEVKSWSDSRIQL